MLEVQGRLSKKIPLPHVVFRLRPAIIVCKEEKSKGIILCKKPSCVEKSMSIALQATATHSCGFYRGLRVASTFYTVTMTEQVARLRLGPLRFDLIHEHTPPFTIAVRPF